MAEIERLAAATGVNRFELHDGLLGAKSIFTQEWRRYYLRWQECQIDYANQLKFEKQLKEIRRKERERKAAARVRRQAERLKREAAHKAWIEEAQRENDRLEREEAAKRAQLAAAAAKRRLVWEQQARFDEMIRTCYRLADGSIWLRPKPTLEQNANQILSEHVARHRDIQKLWRDTYDRSLHKF